MMRRKLLTICAVLTLVNASPAQTPRAETPAEAQASEKQTGVAQAVVVEKDAAKTDAAQTPAVTGYLTGGAACAARCQRFWASADYVVGWFEGTGLPPLVTSSPAGTPQALAGVLGAPATTTLFGAGPANNELRSGLRFAGGYWLGDARTLGIEAGFMVMESQATLFGAASDGTSILARPFTSAVDSSPQAVLVAFPGSSSGAIDIRSGSGNFYEAHFDLTEKIWDENRLRITTLFGYRYFRYDEAFNVRQLIAPAGPNFVPGTQIRTNDNFRTENEFNGFDFGTRVEFFGERLGLELLAKLAVGRMYRLVNINGSQVTTVPGAATVTQTGGVFALSSNSGDFDSREWTLMPELGTTLNWRLNDKVRLRAGYSVIFLGDIVRAADQIDTTINPGLFPPPVLPLVGPNRPAFNLNREDVWLQTLTFGVEFTY